MNKSSQFYNTVLKFNMKSPKLSMAHWCIGSIGSQG